MKKNIPKKTADHEWQKETYNFRQSEGEKDSKDAQPSSEVFNDVTIELPFLSDSEFEAAVQTFSDSLDIDSTQTITPKFKFPAEADGNTELELARHRGRIGGLFLGLYTPEAHALYDEVYALNKNTHSQYTETSKEKTRNRKQKKPTVPPQSTAKFFKNATPELNSNHNQIPPNKPPRKEIKPKKRQKRCSIL